MICVNMLIISIIIAVVLIAADQFIKYWAVTELMPVGTMDFIKIGDTDVLGFRYVQNFGAAFSSFSGARIFLIVLTSALIIALSVWAVRDKKKHPFMMISVSAVVAGGIANLIDRIRLGYVVDYLEVRLFNFAIFNFPFQFLLFSVIIILILLNHTYIPSNNLYLHSLPPIS